MNKNYEKLPKGWETIVSKEYESGASDVEVKASLRMTSGVFDSLYNDPVTTNFRQIVDFGRMLAKAWWMRQARVGLRDKTLNANLWYMVMKNQYGYSDKTTVSTKDAVDLSDDELNDKLVQAVAKFTKTHKA
jgi:hypothetical protein